MLGKEIVLFNDEGVLRNNETEDEDEAVSLMNRYPRILDK